MGSPFGQERGYETGEDSPAADTSSKRQPSDRQKKVAAVGRSMNQESTAALRDEARAAASRINQNPPPAARYVDVPPPSFRKGGKVRHTGLAKVHRGERVLNRKQTREYDKRGAKR